MKKRSQFVINTFMGGLLIVVPICLAVLLMMKAMDSVANLVRPLSTLLPDWLPAEKLLSLLLVLLICFSIGAAVRTQPGQAARPLLEKTLFAYIPGYGTIRSLTHRMAGDGSEKVWKPAFAEIEEALVPAFIIEEFDDGRYTVFVPSVPTPFAGAVYILDEKRVHPLDLSMTQMLRVISRWGSGAKNLGHGLIRFIMMARSHIPELGNRRPSWTNVSFLVRPLGGRVRLSRPGISRA